MDDSGNSVDIRYRGKFEDFDKDTLKLADKLKGLVVPGTVVLVANIVDYLDVEQKGYIFIYQLSDGVIDLEVNGDCVVNWCLFFKGIECFKINAIEFHRQSTLDFSALRLLSVFPDLSLRFRQVTDLDLRVVENLSNLTALSVSCSWVTNLQCLVHLPKKADAVLFHCGIEHIPKELICSDRYVRFGRQRTFSRKLTSVVQIIDSSIRFPPKEIALQGQQVMRSYVDSLQGEVENLNEAKLILVGEGAAGKTSLVNLLRGKPFNKNESQTHGIRVESWQLQLPSESDLCEEVKVHCWDFGGQEIMRATHQVFLSDRCVYVLVLDSRKDEKPEDWLKQIQAVSTTAPIVVVSNKIDEHPDNNLQQQHLREKYPQIAYLLQNRRGI